jgi:uncharacterized protein (TIGR00369 family)
MALRRLHNDDWGFESNCFVCEPRNELGLRVPFFHDDVADIVVAELNLSSAYSGAPNFVHGGITLALLDEAQAWVCMAVGHQWAVTTETSTKFLRPVYVERNYRVEARLESFEDGHMRTTGVVIDEKGKVRAESAAVFATFGEAYLQAAVGPQGPAG